MARGAICDRGIACLALEAMVAVDKGYHFPGTKSVLFVEYYRIMTRCTRITCYLGRRNRGERIIHSDYAMFAMAAGADRDICPAPCCKLAMDARLILLQNLFVTAATGSRNVEVVDGRVAESRRKQAVCVFTGRMAIGAYRCQPAISGRLTVNASLVNLEQVPGQIVLTDQVNLAVTAAAGGLEVVSIGTGGGIIRRKNVMSSMAIGAYRYVGR